MKTSQILKSRGFFLSIALGCLFFFSCSSSPKDQPTEVLTNRNAAANELELANRMASQGKYADALLIAQEARRMAVSTDDPALLIRTALSRGNILFALGRHDEAFRDWEGALEEGESAGLGDLAALARIYTLRGRLRMPGNSPATVQELRDQVNASINAVQSDSNARAAGWIVLGMAEKELERYDEAEGAARRALGIHEESRNQEEIAYAWYFIASVYSVSGRHDDALSALGTAIDFDRRAENGFGLASSWQALGEVRQKTGDASGAEKAFRRAAEIYRAIGLEDLAVKAEARIGG